MSVSVEPLARSILAGVLRSSDGETGRADVGLFPVFEDERPLAGLTAMFDWRACGRLSRLVREGRFVGRRFEALLMPGRRGLPAERIVLYGLGRASALDSTAAEGLATRLHELTTNLCARDVLFAAPAPTERSAGETLFGRLGELLRGDRGAAHWRVVADPRVAARLRRLLVDSERGIEAAVDGDSLPGS